MPRRPDLTRRATLAGAALDVLCARGMQTSMRELAGALGVKRPTLYFYFPDLRAVIEAALDELYRGLTAAVRARVRDHEHPLDRVRAALDAVLAFHRERPQLLDGVLQLWALGGRDVPAALERERRAVLAARDALVADLRAGIARKDVRPCVPEHVADLVLGFLEGAVLRHALGLADTDDAVDELARRVLDPLRPRRRRRARS